MLLLKRNRWRLVVRVAVLVGPCGQGYGCRGRADRAGVLESYVLATSEDEV
jgi:hypothetical protein